MEDVYIKMQNTFVKMQDNVYYSRAMWSFDVIMESILYSKGHVNEAYVATESEKGGEAEKTAENGSIKENAEGGEVDDRPTWSNGMEFLMSCISMSVGLGNIWRFPFTAYENGGGAFLIPYIIVLFIVGKPMYFMEMVLGQFSSRNNVRVWVVTPAMKGIGFGQLLATACIVSYYASLMALTLFYLIQSFKPVLPWTVCLEEWKPECYSASEAGQEGVEGNVSSSELYFLKEVLREYDDIDNGIGVPDWRLTLCLFGAWVGIFLVMVRGVKSSGKAAYFLALFPYVIMIVLLVRAATLEGAVDGILFFISPEWSELLNPKVWYAAVTQAFFSLSVCIGAIIMFSSYNQFTHNVYRDSMIVTTMDTFTSLLAGFTIFGILGNLAHEKGEKDIGKVIGAGGTGLAFISYPDAIAKFEGAPQVFSVLFFLMLFVLGLGSAVSLQSAIVTVLADHYRKTMRYWQVSLIACTAGFLIGLIYVTPGGQFILTLVDKFGGTFLILGMAIAEIAGIFWFYGLEDFCEDLEFMTGRKISVYWRWCWGVITPLMMWFVFLYGFINDEPLKYGSKEMPVSAHASGWTLLVIGLLQIPIWAFVSFVRNKEGTWLQTVRKCFRSSPKWGPKDPKIRQEWVTFKEELRKERDSLGYGRLRHILSSLNGSYRRGK
ncbi:sodium-dependent nutrient amino acid transporter 1-like isoform X1 [Arctopsyche grandis]|uniref:sodium-dependent nutrient amino acid transporter 1-like isoform X1 n=1 Tax=Arctopsyche grandis TaxID=121162 RepID=UPI00406D8FB4